MVISTLEKRAMDFALELNPAVKISSGINWHWAYGFATTEEAKRFDKYCNSIGLETRGVYSNDNGTADVRFRH